ncbi:RIP metalloprotease RseP [Fuchsiella alkaliacetigena]|uniref:RIP metalloprotease RseP n=1 Tax=Fuchsiella alkaliacetigena TaxID=957042 RepID=UPI00200AD97E|nr:RIP metalloprotease RseP [Fuchsiella alkaliacetigena]MCK8823513.1 RIP metalloprotease RseP [Fuchsiella alkaliacetigena]
MLNTVLSLLSTLIPFVVVIGILIFVHEFGHFIIAKKTGVLVEEFAVGMGPKIIGKQRGETFYSLRWFPIGGYCKMTGEFPVDEEDDEVEDVQRFRQAYDNERCLFQKSVGERAAVISAGPVMNFLLAILIFALTFMFFGVPVEQSQSTVIGDVMPDQPAAEAGISALDKVVEIEGQAVDNWTEMAGIINNNPGEELEIVVERQGSRRTFQVVPEYDEERGVGLIGVLPDVIREPVGLLESIKVGAQQTLGMTAAIITGVWQMITGQMAPQVAGPVRIAQEVGSAAQLSLLRVMNLTAILSVNLGILNLLPFPALDGGRLVFLGVEALRGKAIDPEKEGLVHFVGLMLLLVLMIVIVYRDIINIF